MHTMWRSTTQDRWGCNHCKCNRFHIGQAFCLTGIVLSIEIVIFVNGGDLLLYLSLVLRCLFEESFVYCCLSFYVALAGVVLSTRIMICSYCCVTLSFLFQWCCVQWRTESENIGCQETMGAHLHLQCYHLIFITNKYNFQKKCGRQNVQL